MIRDFISVTWTPEVDIRDARLLGRTIEDVYRRVGSEFGPVRGQFDPLPALQVFGAWSLPDVPDDAAYANIRWYVAQSLSDEGEHLVASRYLRVVNLEPWQARRPHFDLVMTALPLIDDICSPTPASDAMGFSRRGMLSMISTHPFDIISNFSQRGRAIQWICAHYIGRMFDVPRHNRPADLSFHHDAPYCTNACTMRYTETPYQVLMFAREQEKDDTVFCPTCQSDLAAQATGFHYGLN